MFKNLTIFGVLALMAITAGGTLRAFFSPSPEVALYGLLLLVVELVVGWLIARAPF